jgi:hypothetical protein
VLAAVLLLSGCGGAKSSAPTQAQFVARANAICAADLRSAAHLKSPRSAAELLPFSEHTSAIVSTLASELDGVTPPSSSRVAYTRFLKTLAREAHLLDEVVTGLRTRSALRARRALEGLNSNAVNQQAQALGIAECARTISSG